MIAVRFGDQVPLDWPDQSPQCFVHFDRVADKFVYSSTGMVKRRVLVTCLGDIESTGALPG